jgi:hypothetical protein
VLCLLLIMHFGLALIHAAAKPAQAKAERLSVSASLHATQGVHAILSYNSSRLQVSNSLLLRFDCRSKSLLALQMPAIVLACSHCLRERHACMSIVSMYKQPVSVMAWVRLASADYHSINSRTRTILSNQQHRLVTIRSTA